MVLCNSFYTHLLDADSGRLGNNVCHDRRDLCSGSGGADGHWFGVGANAVAPECIVGRGGGPQEFEMVRESIDHENQANYAVNGEICR